MFDNFSGQKHSCVLLMSGVQCWGHNKFNQANGVTLIGDDILEFEVGAQHNCIVTLENSSGKAGNQEEEDEDVNENNQLKCWGWNKYGQCTAEDTQKVLFTDKK